MNMGIMMYYAISILDVQGWEGRSAHDSDHEHATYNTDCARTHTCVPIKIEGTRCVWDVGSNEMWHANWEWHRSFGI